MKAKELSNGFCEFISLLEAKIERDRAFLETQKSLIAQAALAPLCGSWIALGSSNSLLVQPCEDGVSLLLCDNSRCYKTIVQDTVASWHQGRLLLDAPGRKAEREITLSEDGILHCGGFGDYRSEHTQLREELEHEMDFSMEATQDDNYDN